MNAFLSFVFNRQLRTKFKFCHISKETLKNKIITMFQTFHNLGLLFVKYSKCRAKN